MYQLFIRARRQLNKLLSEVEARLLSRGRPRRSIAGLVVVDYSDNGKSERYFSTIQDSLTLLASHDPTRRRRVQRYLGQIGISSAVRPLAVFLVGTRRCIVKPELLELDQAVIASVFAHEAMHARIDQYTVRSSRQQRRRIERLCTMEEIAVMSSIPSSVSLEPWIERRRQEADEAIGLWA